MAAGVFGYLGYDMVRQMERLAPAKPDTIGVPDALHDPPDGHGRVRRRARRDRHCHARSPARRRFGESRVRERAGAARPDCRRRSRRRSTIATPAGDPLCSRSEPVSNTSEARFLEMVERAKEYIRAGDIFQVVLSQRFTTPFALPAFALYRALRRVNPSPFLCFLDFGGFQIVCSSPEILVRVADGKVTIRPIAGTRWRGKIQ